MEQGSEDALSDAETLAGRELGERAAKLRRRILLPHLIVGATSHLASLARGGCADAPRMPPCA
jgi:hypothetical protein